jgi:hypothetical protein
VRFPGNRIALIGQSIPGGGSVRVRVDSKEPEEVAGFATDYILPRPGPGPSVLQEPGPGDVAPHAVALGKGIVPQSWSIIMTSDSGDYRLVGSVSGFDGSGNSTRLFQSRSGQISIDPALWRHNREEAPGGKVVYGNRAGDRFEFQVVRTVVSAVSFRSEASHEISIPLVSNLPNGSHTVDLVAAGDGDVIVSGFHVAEPRGD